MPNVNLTDKVILKEVLRLLVNNLKFAAGANREYDSRFAVKGAKVGNSVDVKRPPRYVGSDNVAIAIEDTYDSVVPVKLTNRAQVAMEYTSEELTLDIEDFSKKVAGPAAISLANKIDRNGMIYAYQHTYNSVGTPGTVPSTLLTYLNAGAELDEDATPMDEDRRIILGPRMQVGIVDGLKGLFQSSNQIKSQYEKGVMGTAAGFDWSMSQNVVTHTVGPLGGTPLTNGVQAGLTTGWALTGTLVTDGWTAAAASRLKRGDLFTLATVNAVNPVSRESTGQLQQFVVVNDFSSDAGGAGTITISPPIISAGQFKNVSNSVPDNVAITVIGAANATSPQGLAYHKSAFTLATVDLILPSGSVDSAVRISDKESGISIRMIRQYDINTDKFPQRLDVLYGWAEIYPECSCRIHS